MRSLRTISRPISSVKLKINNQKMALIIGAFFFSLTLSSCSKVKLSACQKMTSLGLVNIPNCSHDNVQYNELGFVSESQQQAKQSRILLLGDELLAGENLKPNERINFRLKEKLEAASLKKVEIINGGMRGVSSANFARNFSRYLKHYRPQIVIYLINGSQQLGRDHFMPRRVNNLCPIWDILTLAPGIDQQYWIKTFNALKTINAQAQAAGVKTLFAWIDEGLKTKVVLEQLEGCGWLKTMVRPLDKNLYDLMDTAARNDVELLNTVAFIDSKRRAKWGIVPKHYRQQHYNLLLTEILVPWVLGIMD